MLINEPLFEQVAYAQNALVIVLLSGYVFNQVLCPQLVLTVSHCQRLIRRKIRPDEREQALEGVVKEILGTCAQAILTKHVQPFTSSRVALISQVVLVQALSRLRERAPACFIHLPLSVVYEVVALCPSPGTEKSRGYRLYCQIQ